MPAAVELVERLEEAVHAAVEEVVRGKRHDVDAVGVAELRQHGRIDAEDDAVVDGEVVDDRALEVVERDVGAADERGDSALVAGRHGVDDVEPVADEARRRRVRVDRGVLGRAAAEDPLPAAAQGDAPRTRRRGPGTSRRGS